MRKLLLVLAFVAQSAHAAATICYAVASGNWTDNIWAGTSAGAAGSCAALGGSGVTIQGQTATIPAHVPGTAGAFDRAVINSGVTVHIPAGLGVDLGETTFNNPGAANSLTINATNAGAYGALVVDKRGLLRLHGASTGNDNYALIAQYAVLQVMPGGALWFGNAANSPQLQVNGRLYVGCGDQTSYPTPFCAGNAGAWVTPTAGASFNFTASTLPAGLSAGDLVELSPTPQPLSVGYPYNINGVTPPPAPPAMPTTNDTGTGPMRTCGSAASCLVPNDTLLCVVAVSGSSVSLGWPQGGDPSQPYCTGAETAMAITAAGTGKLWMKKPALFWADPSTVTWNNTKTASWSSQVEGMDALRSGAYITAAPVSNAAGNGPGRYGDDSLTIGTNTFGASTSGEPCRFLSVEQVTSSGCYVSFSSGAVVAFGANLTMTGAWTFKGPSTLAQTKGAVLIPTGSRTYNEMVFTNSDVRYIYGGGTTGAAFIQFANLPNTANNHIAWVGNTAFMSTNLVGLNGVSLSNTTPLAITGNSFLASNIGGGLAPISLWAASSYVDISHNYTNLFVPLFGCNINGASGYSSAQTFDHITDVNNQIFSSYYTASDNHYWCNWTNRFSADNRITGNGASELTSGRLSVAYGTNNANTSNANNVFIYNYISTVYRPAFLSSGQTWTKNYVTFARHHTMTVTSYDGEAYGANVAGARVGGIKVDHNVFLTTSNIQCFNSGYVDFQHIDGLEFSNNLCVTGSGIATAGGFEIGDTDAGFTGITGLKLYSNIFGQGLGIIKQALAQYNHTAGQLVYAGWNSAVGANTMYAGYGTPGSVVPANIVNPEMYRTVSVTQGGSNYNVSTSRNIKGVAIQNPTYSTTTSGCLKYNYTDQANITMQWSTDPACGDGSTGYGAAVQLNWGGAGTSYTASSVAAGNVSYMTLTTGANSFTAAPANVTTQAGSAPPAGCPMERWAWAMTGVRAGTAYAIIHCPGTYNTATNQLVLAPQDTTLGTANFAVLQWEIRLYDGGGTNHIDIGIDARSLPNPGTPTILVDSGITLTPTDYCGAAQGCARSPAVSGLPTSVTTNVSNAPLVPIALPIQGGSAEQALCNGNPLCGGVAYYRPAGSAWLTAGPGGSQIGPVGAPAATLPAAAIW